ncbi:small ribosomal subunit protein uS7-like [Primulina tabacum]|uniref:small ribosomal subunit protein uS7-like n=1 Tax=Primulina tabacum TaxID=48773 RepID=UPI003F5A5305
MPHTSGRYQTKRFRKGQCPILERLTNSFMMHERNNGKKLMAVRIMKHTMEIIHLLTDQNPIQVIVGAVINSGPREDASKIGSAGVAIYLLTTGARKSAFRNIKTIAECLADELINAAKGSSNRRQWDGRMAPYLSKMINYAIKKKDEIERVAKSHP